MVTTQRKSLLAIHRLLHHGRQLAGERAAGQELFTYFDELDGLMGYVISWESVDMTVAFEQELRRICVNFKAPHIFEEYTKN